VAAHRSHLGLGHRSTAPFTPFAHFAHQRGAVSLGAWNLARFSLHRSHILIQRAPTGRVPPPPPSPCPAGRCLLPAWQVCV
jgi:hypothetical protein